MNHSSDHGLEIDFLKSESETFMMDKYLFAAMVISLDFYQFLSIRLVRKNQQPI